MTNGGRVVIITGSSSGIGKASAILLASQGWRVVVNCSSSVAAANAVVDEIKTNGGQAIVVQADVGKDEECKKLVDKAIEAFGRLDAVVNNAGTTKFNAHTNLRGLSTEDFLRIYSVNVVAPYNMVKYAEPHLRSAGNAAVVMVSSIAGVMGVGSSIAYAASKGALNTMTLSLARNLGPEIRVNAVCPGFIEGEWLRNGLGDKAYEAARNNYISTTPLRATVTAEEVAECVAFFCSSASKVTGEVMMIDAGTHLGSAPAKAR
ncbi:NAD(P)-binding protein [Gonapodya prolifera JEL478]|uniref:NAD(P)-binding protein n=1 Tax=Gonapodya prolifera (strain JEL478) TaxID=1344416 RepID=A0A138ZZC8_GONPJ|nr:NAD(P)-binding protein [Gonapodya prolifera JEL478]|eukprot:KXS09625.1 NAD(P)-binding protein [Gonapodya prolifera JEL478]